MSITMHPGEYIKTVYMEDPYSFTEDVLAKALNIDLWHMRNLLSGTADFSLEQCHSLCYVLGRSAESWFCMQRDFNNSKLIKLVKTKDN